MPSVILHRRLPDGEHVDGKPRLQAMRARSTEADRKCGKQRA
jgi:hypothetical protein